MNPSYAQISSFTSRSHLPAGIFSPIHVIGGSGHPSSPNHRLSPPLWLLTGERGESLTYPPIEHPSAPAPPFLSCHEAAGLPQEDASSKGFGSVILHPAASDTLASHRLPTKQEPSGAGSLDTITRQRRAEGDGHRLPLYSSDGAAGHRLTGRIKSIRPTALHICQNCEAYHLAIRGRKCYYEPQCLLIRFARFVDSIMAQVAYKVGVGD